MIKYLTSEELEYNNGILYFYSSSNNIIGEILFQLINELNDNVICIDLDFYKNFYKRFDIVELPTLLIINNNEIKKIIGTDILDVKQKFADILTNGEKL